MSLLLTQLQLDRQQLSRGDRSHLSPTTAALVLHHEIMRLSDLDIETETCTMRRLMRWRVYASAQKNLQQHSGQRNDLIAFYRHA